MTRCPHCESVHAPEDHFCPVSGRPIELGSRLISQTLIERFHVLQVLGKGTISVVLEVEELISKTRYAAKLIHPQYTRGQDHSIQFLEDAKMAGELGSRHIAETVAVGRDAGAALTVVRELMTGKCLKEVLREEGRLELQRAVQITRGLLTGLGALHEAGILLLDLSPSDVFLAEHDGQEIAKLVDLGERHIKHRLIREADVKFPSCQYYAPEQFDSSRQQNPKTDLYAAGAIFYQMVTSKVPEANLVDTSDVFGQGGAELVDIMKTALAGSPANRFESAEAFIEAINQFDMNLATGNLKTETAPRTRASISEVPRAVDAEQDKQASVIVDMPEIDRARGKKRVGLAIAAVVVVLIAVFAFYRFMLVDPAELAESILLRVVVDPKSAIVTVDGRRVEGDPPVVDVPKDDQFHTIKAKAEGFESIEKDVEYDVSKTITLTLTEIIRPDDNIPTELPVEEPSDAGVPDVVEIVESPAPKSEPVKAPKARPKARSATRPKTRTTPTPAGRTKPIKTRGSRPASEAPKSKPKSTPRKKTRDGLSTVNPFG